MLTLALKMLMGDRAKFIGMLIGLTFATFIITQQAGIFIGLMTRTYGFLTDTSQPDIWVMDPRVQYVDDVKPVKLSRLYQVRSIEGVEWAVPIFKGLLKARLQNGQFQSCNVIGIDDSTLIGGPPEFVEGSIYDLRIPNAIIVNEVGAQDKLASPGEDSHPPIPLSVGQEIEMNDHRAIVVGICKVTRTFLSQPVVYTTFKKGINFSPPERNLLTFVLVKAAPGVDTETLAEKIKQLTGLAAYTTKGFKRLTVKYYLLNTGIPINFGIAVILGFIIGIAIAGQTFYSFAHDNRHFFATFKVMGATKKILIRMMLSQALMTALISWSIGVGITALFGILSENTELSFRMPWWLLLGSGVSILLMTLLSALTGLFKIIKLEPGIVFQS